MTLFAYNDTFIKRPRESMKQFLQLKNQFRKSLDTVLICKT